MEYSINWNGRFLFRVSPTRIDWSNGERDEKKAAHTFYANLITSIWKVIIFQNGWKWSQMRALEPTHAQIIRNLANEYVTAFIMSVCCTRTAAKCAVHFMLMSNFSFDKSKHHFSFSGAFTSFRTPCKWNMRYCIMLHFTAVRCIWIRCICISFLALNNSHNISTERIAKCNLLFLAGNALRPRCHLIS